MIVSKFEGTIDGFEKPFDYQGVGFQVGTLGSIGGRMVPVTYFMPFNENRPDKVVLNDYAGKRVRITMEIIEQ